MNPELNANGDHRDQPAGNDPLIAVLEKRLSGEKSREKRKNVIFEEIIISRLGQKFIRQMQASGVDAEQVLQFTSDLYANPDREHVKQLLTVPYEFQQRLFASLAKPDLPPHAIVNTLAQTAAGFREATSDDPLLAYHTSALPIRKPSQRYADDPIDWAVKPKELEGRPMQYNKDDPGTFKTYAARQYQHLFRRDSPKWLYVVRDNTAHDDTLDPTTGWVHTRGVYSIIAEIDLTDVDRTVGEIDQQIPPTV